MLQKQADTIRFLCTDMVQQANSGHPGAPMGMADIAEVLWNDYMNHNKHQAFCDNETTGRRNAMRVQSTAVNPPPMTTTFFQWPVSLFSLAAIM